MKKFLGPQIGFEIRVFAIFSRFASLVFLDIAQDCSLGQCLTSRSAESSKKEKKNCGPNWGWNDLFYSNDVEDPLKLACDIYFRCGNSRYVQVYK